MKRVLIVLALVLSVSLRAQSPQPARLPGEPHHHLKIDNEYVRAYYVEVAPHESTQLHQHDHDYLFVTLGPADVINAVLDKPEVRLVLKDGEAYFTRGGFAHVARNLSDAPFRNVTIELLHRQVNPRNLCARVVAAEPAGPCDKSSTAGTADYAFQSQFETSEIRLDIVRMAPKSKHTELATKLSWLVVGLGDSKVRVAVKGKPEKILSEGEIVWANDDSEVVFSNPGSKAATLFQMMFKNTR